MLPRIADVGLHPHTEFKFQWAPTLGGECYKHETAIVLCLTTSEEQFQWAPTLGGECYLFVPERAAQRLASRFNGHPPLGVNATV